MELVNTTVGLLHSERSVRGAAKPGGPIYWSPDSPAGPLTLICVLYHLVSSNLLLSFIVFVYITVVSR